MPISFSCPACGKRFSVADEFAGRDGTCKGCGHAITVPPHVDEDDDEYGIAKVGYGLVDSAPKSTRVVEDEGNVFQRTPHEARERSTYRPRSDLNKPKRKRRNDEYAFLGRNFKALIIISAVVCSVLFLVAVVVPSGRMIVAMMLGSVGTLLFLVGFVGGVYVAFTEDGMYGWLCLVFPIYTAYYMVSRWDEMWPWFGAMTVGFGLTVSAGIMIGNGRAAQVRVEHGFIRPSDRAIPLVSTQRTSNTALRA